MKYCPLCQRKFPDEEPGHPCNGLERPGHYVWREAKWIYAGRYNSETGWVDGPYRGDTPGGDV